MAMSESRKAGHDMCISNGQHKMLDSESHLGVGAHG